MLWRRKWQPTPVSLPAQSHGQRSLVGCSPWGSKESSMTERLTLTPSSGGLGSIPGQGTRSRMPQHKSHAVTKIWCSQINKYIYLKKKKQTKNEEEVNGHNRLVQVPLWSPRQSCSWNQVSLLLIGMLVSTVVATTSFVLLGSQACL